jgi:hypothetical protein
MRRLLLLPLLAAALVPFAPSASAGCEPPEEGQPQECHAVDCVAWEPQAPTVDEAVSYVTAGQPDRLVTWLLPPACPS